MQPRTSRAAPLSPCAAVPRRGRCDIRLEEIRPLRRPRRLLVDDAADLLRRDRRLTVSPAGVQIGPAEVPGLARWVVLLAPTVPLVALQPPGLLAGLPHPDDRRGSPL